MTEQEAAEYVAAYAKQLEKNDLMIRLAAIIGITITGVAFFKYVKDMR